MQSSPFEAVLHDNEMIMDVEVIHSPKSHEFSEVTEIQSSSHAADKVWFSLIHYSAFLAANHVALDRNPGTGYDTLLLLMIPGNL